MKSIYYQRTPSNGSFTPKSNVSVITIKAKSRETSYDGNHYIMESPYQPQKTKKSK